MSTNGCNSISKLRTANYAFVVTKFHCSWIKSTELRKCFALGANTSVQVLNKKRKHSSRWYRPAVTWKAPRVFFFNPTFAHNCNCVTLLYRFIQSNHRKEKGFPRSRQLLNMPTQQFFTFAWDRHKFIPLLVDESKVFATWFSLILFGV